MTDITQITSGVFKSGANTYRYAHASVRKTGAPKNDDVVLAIERDDELAIALGDGATGFGFGDVAARAFGAFFLSDFESPNTARKSKRFLIDADTAVRAACEGTADGADTTAIVLSVSAAGIQGASVGDSQAVIFGTSVCDLTVRQRRRQRLGNGSYPEEFTARLTSGDVLVMASDGLWNMVRLENVGKTALAADGMDQAVHKLLVAARNSVGDYGDDVSVFCLRMD
jgi:serine/threonine protein phosphatase PrpC